MQKNNNIKILATLGPASMTKSIVENMDSSGVDLFRINLSHTKIEDFEKIVNDIQSWTKKPICVDTEGAQIRTGTIKNGKVKIKNNSLVSITSSEVLGDSFNIPIYPINPSSELAPGDIVALDFNAVIIQVVEIRNNKVTARVLSGGIIGSNKAANIDRPLKLSPFTLKDIKAFEISKTMGLNHFALSFASKKDDILNFRSFFDYPIFLISKIESKFGLNNLKEICEESDAILIDRGDLSREIPIQKIALVQKHILETAKNLKTPVFVATNLLENMVNNFVPTRAEISDITNILLAGSQGLVLAAETAIGKYPVSAVRMAVNVKKEVENYKNSGKEKYFNGICDYDLIEPHGGVLVQNFITPDKAEALLNNLKEIKIDECILSDVFQIAEGTYSPICGFMNKEELYSVLDDYRLPSGVVWTLPILMQMKKEDINFKIGERIALKRAKDNVCYALMDISNIEKIDVDSVSLKWFGTNDNSHPGVMKFKTKGDYIISGEVFLFKKPDFGLDSYILTPSQTRTIFKNRGWQKIVGFHTRNVIHRGHEFIQKKSLEMINADALFISPVIGQKKEKDFSAYAIIRAYETMIENNYYGQWPTLISAFNTYSRYSGPREAVFTALCRKNFGCSYFVVGRDHTGVGNFYSPDASHRIFDNLKDIGIVPLFFNEVYFCKSCNKHTDNCIHEQKNKLSLSGTKVRECLLNGLEVPEYLIRKKIFNTLKELSKNSVKLFEE